MQLTESQTETLNKLVDALSPLTHKDRDSILGELISYRDHWFQRETVMEALRRSTSIMDVIR